MHVVESPRTRVSPHGLCVEQDRVLLVRLAPPLPDAGSWGLPGGGLDWGETPEEAVVREFREETGLTAVVEGIAGTYSHTFLSTPLRPEPALHFLSIMFWVRVTVPSSSTRQTARPTWQLGFRSPRSTTCPSATLPCTVSNSFASGLQGDAQPNNHR